ncbi:MAG: hypothetical protein JSS66_05010 [Armatimonadetes bacterium]|nr:hypothetical protein [Armatimonadota bacterium]
MKPAVDVAILSYTKNDKFFTMTQHCLESLHESEPDFDFRVHLVETNPRLKEDGYDYGQLVERVVQPSVPFNYNLYLNQVLPAFDTEYCVVLNNDVLCHQGWFGTIVRSMEEHNLDSASPKCPRWAAHRPFTSGVHLGHVSGVHFCGWCLVFRLHALKSVLPLDEAFSFWYQDNDLAQLLKCTDKRHALVATSLMTHLESQSHELYDPVQLQIQTNGMRQVFAEKWGLYH